MTNPTPAATPAKAAPAAKATPAKATKTPAAKAAPAKEAPAAKATPAKAVPAQPRGTHEEALPNGTKVKVPNGYELKWPHGGHSLLKKTGEHAGPEWFVLCNAHGTVTAAKNAKEGETLGAKAERVKWCDKDHDAPVKAPAAKATKATPAAKAAPAAPATPDPEGAPLSAVVDPQDGQA